MTAPTVRFAPRSAFHQTLRERVDALFPHEDATTGGLRWAWKVSVALGLTLAGYLGLLFVAESLAGAALFGVALYAGWILLAFNVMHDGAHGSATRHRWLNYLSGSAMELLGGSQWLWQQKHNNMHHTFTNIFGKDDDINAGWLMRLSDDQPWQRHHRFQFIYAWGMYCLLSLFMIVQDFIKYLTKKIGHTQLPQIPWHVHISFWTGKIFYLSYALVIPMLMHGFWPTVVMFLLLHAAFGLTMAVVFQLAHVVEGVETPVMNPVMASDWATHQVLTTVDFAPRNRLLTWCVGGLNFQVEHHLFHRISHVHYALIQQVVKATCAEFHVPYVCFPNLRTALWSHAKQLYLLSQPTATA